MILVVMHADGTLSTIDTTGQWRPIVWAGEDLPVVPWAESVPQDAVIMQDMLPFDTIDAYLADRNTLTPVVTVI